MTVRVSWTIAVLVGCQDPPADDVDDEGRSVGLASLELVPAAVDVTFPGTTRVGLIARDPDGDVVPLDGPPAFVVADPTIAAVVETDATGFTVQGLVPGSTTLDVLLGQVSTTAPVEVGLPANASLTLRLGVNDGALGVGEETTLSASVVVDETTADVSERAVWTSSDPDVLSVDGTTATGEQDGFATVEVSFEGLTDAREVEVGCPYPQNATSELVLGEVVPRIRWTSSVRFAGDSSPFTDSYDVNGRRCGGDPPATVAFVATGASWCLPCAASISNLAGDLETLADLGMDVVVIGVWGTANGGADLMGTPDTVSFVQTYSNGPLWVAGGIDTLPTNALFEPGADLVPAVPALLVVRTRDMVLIAADTASLPLVDIATNPEWDWTDPDNPVPN